MASGCRPCSDRAVCVCLRVHVACDGWRLAPSSYCHCLARLVTRQACLGDFWVSSADCFIMVC